jgi:hypothetical protein
MMLNWVQVVVRFPKLILLFLLGCRQGLGPHPFRTIRRTKQPGASVGFTTTYTLPYQRVVLWRYCNRFDATLHMEFQIITAFGPFQRLGGRYFRDGVSGGAEALDVDLLSSRNGMGSVFQGRV